MFGKPEWFRKKAFGWGLTPVTWQGWTYAGLWAAILAGPFNVLLLYRGVGEALVWMIASLAVLVWDVYHIRQAMNRASGKDVLYIGDDDQQVAQTRELNLRVRR